MLLYKLLDEFEAEDERRSTDGKAWNAIADGREKLSDAPVCFVEVARENIFGSLNGKEKS
jgi:hypothetical protein